MNGTLWFCFDTVTKEDPFRQGHTPLYRNCQIHHHLYMEVDDEKVPDWDLIVACEKCMNHKMNQIIVGTSKENVHDHQKNTLTQKIFQVGKVVGMYTLHG